MNDLRRSNISIRGYRLLTIAFLCLFLSLSTSMKSFASETIPSLLKIGLQYGSLKDTSIPLVSNEGYVFGEYKESQWVTYLDYSKVKYMYLIKNGLNVNETVLTQPGQVGSMPYGKYHLQIGGQYLGVSLAQADLVKIKAIDSRAFLSYDGSWKIYLGSFLTEAEMNVALQEITNKLMPINVQRAPFNYNAFMLLIDNKVELLFDGSVGDLGFKNPLQNGTLYFNKYKYRGALVFKRFTGSDPTVINQLPMNEYLYGVVPYEISPDWHPEALKAQAVAARNYALISMGKHKKYGFDVCSTVDCQVYGGFNVEKPSSNGAVDLTTNRILKYNGKLAQTYFHSNSGGRTENSENIWNLPIPYIIAVDDPFSVGAPNTNWSVTYTAEQFNQLLIEKKYNIGSLKDIYVESYSPNGRALKTTFVGTTGKLTLEKDKVRSIFKTGDLKSTWFTISTGNLIPVQTADSQTAIKPADFSVIGREGVVQKFSSSSQLVVTDGTVSKPLRVSNDVYVFTGKGYGHGLGLSQWGVKKMAELGYTYEQILAHYYPGTNLE